jgi:hypothetical protein
MKLSQVQTEALIRKHGALSEFGAAAFVGKSRNQTLHSLERRGLVRYYPTPEHWKLTRDGRDWLDEENSRLANAEHAAKNAAIVERYQRRDKAKSILVECDECRGTGEVEATCSICNIDLTHANVEPGTDDICKVCMAKEEGALWPCEPARTTHGSHDNDA